MPLDHDARGWLWGDQRGTQLDGQRLPGMVGNKAMSDTMREGEGVVTVRLSLRAANAVRQIQDLLGGVSASEAVGKALGTELYLLRFAGDDGAVIIEQKKGFRQAMTVKPGGDNAGRERRG